MRQVLTDGQNRGCLDFGTLIGLIVTMAHLPGSNHHPSYGRAAHPSSPLRIRLLHALKATISSLLFCPIATRPTANFPLPDPIRQPTLYHLAMKSLQLLLLCSALLAFATVMLSEAATLESLDAHFGSSRSYVFSLYSLYYLDIQMRLDAYN